MLNLALFSLDYHNQGHYCKIFYKEGGRRKRRTGNGFVLLGFFQVVPNHPGSPEESSVKINPLKVPVERPGILVSLLIHPSGDSNSSGGGEVDTGNSASSSPQ